MELATFKVECDAMLAEDSLSFTSGTRSCVGRGVFRRQQYLTPLAAIGLLIIMIGAVVVTAMGPGVKFSIQPLIAGLLCAFVAYGRWKVRPLQYSFN